MFDTYIKNKGATKTLVYDNNHNSVNEINWDADYDGKVANISVDLQNNGIKKHYDVTLDNQDLANILNVPSINLPLEKRLKRDFKQQSFNNDPNIYKIEFDDFKPPPLMPIVSRKKNEQSIEELLETIRQQPQHISSPLPNQELIIPLTIDDKSYDNYTFTPKRRHKKIRTHKKYKVYKKPKSSSKSKRRNKNKSSKLTFPFL